MPQTVIFAFSLHQKVYIGQLEISGIVTGIWWGDAGAKYMVRYFDEAQAREIYFYPCELTDEEK